MSDGYQRMYVEFYGIPRERAGTARLEVDANTLGELLRTLATQMPALGEFICKDRLQSAAVANLNGERFVSDPVTPLNGSDCLLILSADAGG